MSVAEEACGVSEAEEDDETWALELEEELLGGGGSADAISGVSETSNAGDSIVDCSGSESVSVPSRFASDLPQEVLVNIMSFTSVGRVSKAWSLAGSTLARRKFLSRLSETLLPFTDDGGTFAVEIEMELFAAYGQTYSLPRSYGQKARQLLFNLKDVRNAALRERLFSGKISPATLVRMSARDMANPQLVRQREQWIKKRTHEVMRDEIALDGFTQTDLFECRSCGSHRTCYRQWRRKAIVDRTRVIVVCRDCPHRWEL